MKKYEVITHKRINDETVLEAKDIFDSKKKAIEFMYEEAEFIKRFFIEKDAVEWYPDLPYDTKEQWYSLEEKVDHNAVILNTYKDRTSVDFIIYVQPIFIKD